MSTYSEASLILPQAPYRKAGKIYSLKPTNGAGDFTVARNSVSKYRNSNGLILEVAVDVPVFEWDLGGSCPYSRLENTKTQLFQYSNEIPNFNGTITDNYDTSPSGSADSMRVIKTSASDQFINQAWLGGVLTGSTDYIVDKYVKYDGFDVDFRVEQNNSNDWDKAWNALFTLDSNGITLGTANNCTSGYISEGNGWHRIWVRIETGTTPVLSSPSVLFRVIGASGISYQVWQINLGESKYVTSSIFSDNTISTRLKDDLICDLSTANVMQGTNFSFHLNKLSTNDIGDLGSDDSIFHFNLSSVLKISIERYRDDSLRVYNSNDTAYMLGGTDGGVWSDALTFTMTYDNGDWIFYRDGVAVGTYTETIPTVVDELEIDCAYGMLNTNNIEIFNTTLTPTEVANL